MLLIILPIVRNIKKYYMNKNRVFSKLLLRSNSKSFKIVENAVFRHNM